ncbi:hypothetical protein C2G38_2050739 [Gigaspora rosea]|uniref:Uncharacterized protein n=1 Tax=Gigaspora rosea TaxID=44941 RepID=A0A397U3I0_9GLOM|nr:hypothetical protein C2G38_2050739 [Gigaspora rosea]
MIELILIETVSIGQFGLKWMAKELPLIKMDLTAFINVTDSGVMHLAEARVIENDLFYFSLTFLSLSGTKLTDVGMSALKDLENLVESGSNLNYGCWLARSYSPWFKQTRIKNTLLSTICKSTFANRKLKYLDVGYTHVTDKGVKELRDKYLFYV